MAGATVSVPELGRSLENETAAHSSATVQNIPWTQEPGRLQCMGSQKSQIQLNDRTNKYIYIFLSLGLI